MADFVLLCLSLTGFGAFVLPQFYTNFKTQEPYLVRFLGLSPWFVKSFNFMAQA